MESYTNQGERNLLYLSSEFIGLKDKVREIIDDRHWGEDGRYKEFILKEYLKKFMPDGVCVGTGFVKREGITPEDTKITSQIDIIIYKDSRTPEDKENILLEAGDFVILRPEAVLGIIEVKTKSTNSNLSCVRTNKTTGKKIPSAIQKATRNGEIIGRHEVFNGIFAYENKVKFTKGYERTKLAKQLIAGCGYVNHIALSANYFIRFWKGRDAFGKPGNTYSTYDLSFKKFKANRHISEASIIYKKTITEAEEDKYGFAYGYFIANLLENIKEQTGLQIAEKHSRVEELTFSLKNTKEVFAIKECRLKLSSDLNQNTNDETQLI